jgi:hypothetical protein
MSFAMMKGVPAFVLRKQQHNVQQRAQIVVSDQHQVAC